MSMFSRNVRSGASPEMMAKRLLAKSNYDLVAMEMIGQDPEMYGVEYVVLGVNPYSVWNQNQYATWILMDWSHHPGESGRGATLSRGDYQIPNNEARRQFEMRVQKERRAGDWVMPDTDFILYR